MAPAVDDDKSLPLLRQSRDQRFVVHVAGMMEAHARQFARQASRIGRELPAFPRQAQGMPGLEAARVERWLRGRAQDDGAAVVFGQLAQHPDGRDEQRARQGLRLVEYDDAFRDVVQLPAARGSRREKALEELHIGGEDDGHPLLGAGSPHEVRNETRRVGRNPSGVQRSGIESPQTLGQCGEGVALPVRQTGMMAGDDRRAGRRRSCPRRRPSARLWRRRPWRDRPSASRL